MMRTTNLTAEPHVWSPVSEGSDCLQIEPAEFRDCFDRRPFLLGHTLTDHPLFTLPRLIELSRTLPAEQVEYNAGDIPISLDPSLTPRNGLSVEETIRRIEDCQSWLVLKYVEHDPDYRELLESCLHEVRAHSEPLRPGMCLPQAFIFITSPRSVTPYHMDPEHNFLLQIRGTKSMTLFYRAVVPVEELERFYDGSHRNMVFHDEYRASSWTYELHPGQGIHVPVTVPHYVENGDAVSISFSITFRTPDLEKISAVHRVNGLLRRRGLCPRPLGQAGWRDSLKYQAFRMWRRGRRLLGRPVA
jgi:hypothetical protein